LPLKEIITIINCSKIVMYDIQKKVKVGKSLARSPGSSCHNIVIDDYFLLGLFWRLKETHTRSMWKLAKEPHDNCQ